VSKVLAAKVDRIKDYIREMGQLALSAISDGVESFAKLDQDLAARVIAEDSKLDELDATIETECIRAIAQFQPVAADLRRLGAYLKAITDLRRIGRYGYDTALLTQRMKGLEHFKRLIKIPEMARTTVLMAKQAIDALLHEKDGGTVKSLMEQDRLVDDAMEELFREVLTYTIEDPRRITVAMYYTLVARYLERAEDHAVSIGWHTQYMLTGRRRFR
jgi:phosphate transport system protein